MKFLLLLVSLVFSLEGRQGECYPEQQICPLGKMNFCCPGLQCVQAYNCPFGYCKGENTSPPNVWCG